jgi:23S rRNA (guanosine2251-2'-O)-methyltransferase
MAESQRPQNNRPPFKRNDQGGFRRPPTGRPEGAHRPRGDDRPRRDDRSRPDGEEAESDGSYVVGRRAVLELLKTEEGRQKIEKLYIAHGTQGPQIVEIVTLLRKHRLPHTEVDRGKFRDLEKRSSDNTDSQGVIALTSRREYQTLDEVMEKCVGRSALLIALDGVEDPHNVGAILRSAEAGGADAVLLHQKRSALTPAVYKTSAGAAEHVAIVKYGNLDQTMRDLRERFGFQILGLAGEAVKTIYETDFTQPTLIIAGSEEKGLHHLTRERCDELVKIPLTGKTESLNASVATAVVLFEAMRQRASKE